MDAIPTLYLLLRPSLTNFYTNNIDKENYVT